MEKNSPSTWNVVAESIRREYGHGGRFERRACGPEWFQRKCLGSVFIVQRMQFSHYVKESTLTNLCMNFKQDRNLICTGNCYRRIHIYDWQKDKLKFTYKTKHSDDTYDLKFLNTGGNGMDLISADFSGQVRHDIIAPAGNMATNRIFLNSWQRHRLITVPRSPLEFMAASSNAGIFLIDLRASYWPSYPETIVSREGGGFLTLEDIAHHPFAPEVCVCGRDKFVRVFDKRSFKKPMKKMHPNTHRKSVVVNHCSYNYDGTEILANYVKEAAYLFDNKCYKDGEFIHMYTECAGQLPTDQIKFFGPKSEYIIRGTQKRKMFFQDKNTKAILESGVESSDFQSCGNSYRLMFESHPCLPVIASAAFNERISIWAPTQLKPGKKGNPYY